MKLVVFIPFLSIVLAGFITGLGGGADCPRWYDYHPFWYGIAQILFWLGVIPFGVAGVAWVMGKINGN